MFFTKIYKHFIHNTNTTLITSCFYIFRGEWIKDDYIRLCTCMVMQTKAWMTSFLFKMFLSFLKKSLVLGEIFQSNWHFLILNGHGSHVTLEAMAQAQELGSNTMVTLLIHTFHVLQPLDVSWFKPFKILFKKEKDNALVKNNHGKLNKCTLVNWVNKSLDQSLSKKYIKNGFSLVIGI